MNILNVKQANIMFEKYNNKTKKLETELESAKDKQQLRKACEDFESYFLQYMFKVMRKTVPKNDLFKESNALKIYESMKYEKLSKEIAKAGGIGIADMLYENLKQEIFSK